MLLYFFIKNLFKHGRAISTKPKQRIMEGDKISNARLLVMRISGLHWGRDRKTTHKTVTAEAKNKFLSESIKAFFWEMKTEELYSALQRGLNFNVICVWNAVARKKNSHFWGPASSCSINQALYWEKNFLDGKLFLGMTDWMGLHV